MIQKIFYQVPVDAGHIMITDVEFFKDWRPEYKQSLNPTFTLEKGDYNCHWSVPNSWLDRNQGKKILKVTSGTVVIGDSCYIVHDDLWMKFLESTGEDDNGYWKKIPRGVIYINTGGDGGFTVVMNLEKRV